MDIVIEVFSRYDRDGNGTIPIAQFRGVVGRLGVRDHVIDELLKAFCSNTNSDGVLHYAEFFKWAADFEPAGNAAVLKQLLNQMSAKQRAHVAEAVQHVAVQPPPLQEKHASLGEPSDHLQQAASKVPDWQEATRQSPQHSLYDEYQELLSRAQAGYSGPVSAFGPRDCLLVVDVQNDFLPVANAPNGGRFGVAEGASASELIVRMMSRAAAAKALIVATRDYHPANHCSFSSHGGPFPAHCVQGSSGSHLYPPIGKALAEAKASGAEVRVAFKGFHAGIDSFGSLRYGEKYFVERTLGNDLGMQPGEVFQGCCALEWTGSFCLECSDIDADINAPPDVLSVFGRKSLQDELQSAGIQRIFVVGLALDFTVLDTALNASAAGLATEGVFIVVDATRAAHIPGVGCFGSGFLSNPEDVVKKTRAQGVRLIKSDAVGDA